MSQTNNTAKAHAYILVEVWDREITNKQFSSFEEAQNELKKTFSSIIDDNNSNEYELGDNWALCNGDYAYDAKIISVA